MSESESSDEDGHETHSARNVSEESTNNLKGTVKGVPTVSDQDKAGVIRDQVDFSVDIKDNVAQVAAGSQGDVSDNMS